MTLKEIKEHYILDKYREDKNKFLVFSNVQGSCNRNVYKYLCLITKNGTKFNVDGFEPTSEISILTEQIESYVSSLGYDSMYDNPHFIKGVREELMIHDYLNDIGFTNDYLSDSYVLKEKNVYGYKANNIRISFFGLNWTDHKKFDYMKGEGLSNEVTIYLTTGDFSWITVKTERSTEKIKEGIDSLLKPLMISESTILFSTAEKMENDTMDVDMLLKSLSGAIDVSSQDYKSILKARLLELADKI